jgi:hypothetical protein
MSSDNATNPSSFLTCLSGAPLTGIHCSTEDVSGAHFGRNSTGPIPLSPITGYAELPPFIIEHVNATALAAPTTDPDCHDFLTFDIRRASESPVTETCVSNWSCASLSNAVRTTFTLAPPSVANPAQCFGKLTSYYHWLNESNESFDVSDFNLGMQEYYCQDTFFKSLDGAEVDAMAVIGGDINLKAGQDLRGTCEENVCSWVTRGNHIGVIVPVNRFEIVAGDGCGSGRQ